MAPWQIFTVLLVVAGVLSVLFAGLAWHKRGEPGARPLVVFHLAVAVGTLAYALDIRSSTLATQLLLAKITLVGQAFTATTWTYVAIEYAGLSRWANWRTLAVLWGEPVAVTALLASPLWRWLFVPPESGVAGSIVHSGIETRPLWFVHFGVLFVVMLTGSFIFVQLFVRSRHIYRTQAGAIAIAAIVPWTTLLVQSFGFAPESDPSALAWALSGMALTAGLYRFKTLDPVPAAHESIVEDMGDGVVVIDEDGLVSDINPAARQLLAPDTDPADLLGRPIDEFFGDWSEVRYGEAGHSAWQELSLTVDGRERYVEVQTSPFTDRFDRVVGRLVVFRDVTDRKRREQTLARYKTIFESVREPSYVLDENWEFILVNDPMAEFLDYDRGALLGTHIDEILTPESRERLRETAAMDAAGPADSSADALEVTVVSRTGDAVPAETRLAPVTFEEETTGYVGFVRDISRRKAVEESLRETEELFETLVESSPLAIVAADTEGRVEVWNPAAERMFGWEADEVLGERLPIIPDESREDIRERHERIFAGERVTGAETELERADGTLVDVSVSIAPIEDSEGEVAGSVSVIADITDRKERERKLQRTNERLDEFASIVSHDLRNPLGVADGNLELAATAPDEQSRIDAIESAREALSRMERIIEDTLTLAREGRVIDELEPVAFEGVIRRAWDTTVTGDATLEVDAVPETVESDEHRLTTLFENLFANAVEHGTGEDGSDVTVRVGPMDGGFYVADDGPGIPPGERDGVFESGYTTSESGTGFGLAIVESIADAHNWTVTVTESADGGARFEFTGVDVIETADAD